MSEYLKNAVYAASTLIVAGLAAGVGCSMDNPAKFGGTFSIKIEDDVNAPKYFSLAQDLGLGVHGYGSQLFSPDSMTGPSTSSDFDCFGVNVTGPGVVSNHEIGSECTVLDNMHGRGEGLVSKKLVRRGEYIDFDLLPGPNRRIDAYGIYPPDQDCGGNNDIPVDQKAYYMGGVDVDIRPNLQVTIPVTFQLDQPPSLACKHDLELKAGFNPPNTAYYDSTSTLPLPSPSPVPTLLSQFGVQDYSNILNADQTFFSVTSVPNYYSQILINFDVTNLTVSDFNNMEVDFVAAAGSAIGSGSCSSLGTVSTPGTMQIWKRSATSWQPIQTFQLSTQPQFYSRFFQNPSDFVFVDFNGRKIISVNVYAQAAQSTECGFVKLDFAAIRLMRN